MKLAARTLLCLAVLGATLIYAQTNNIKQVQHVIIVVQENRTPDNLFGSDLHTQTRQLLGADLATDAPCSESMCGTVCQNDGGSVALVPFQLDACFGPNHGHGWPLPAGRANNAWVTTYDNGKMDGACAVTVAVHGQCNPPAYPAITYVDNTTGTIQPYFDIAKNYGYANYSGC